LGSEETANTQTREKTEYLAEDGFAESCPARLCLPLAALYKNGGVTSVSLKEMAACRRVADQQRQNNVTQAVATLTVKT